MTADRRGRFEAWLDAIDAGEGYYLACENGHTTVPPRLRCPRCGRPLEENDLPRTGTVRARTVVRVPTPRFSGIAPYATALAAFGEVTLTGLVVDADPEAVERGDSVRVGVGRPSESASRCVTFELV